MKAHSFSMTHHNGGVCACICKFVRQGVKELGLMGRHFVLSMKSRLKQSENSISVRHSWVYVFVQEWLGLLPHII